VHLCRVDVSNCSAAYGKRHVLMFTGAHEGHIFRQGQTILRFRCGIASSFWSRLRGLLFSAFNLHSHAYLDQRPAQEILFLANCAAVHTVGMSANLQVVFLDSQGVVVRVCASLPPYRYRYDRRARHVLEVKGTPLPVIVGDAIHIAVVGSLARLRPAGFSTVEVLIALPVLLLAALGALQVGLLWHAKFAVNHAVHHAARHASLHHGSHDSIRDALVQGLVPLFGKSQSLTDLPRAVLRSGAELTQGLAMGYLQWEVLSPTRQSFSDWGEVGDPILSPGVTSGDLEIPSSPLPALALRRKPRSGASGVIDGMLIGNVSGQTLLDANTMKLHLQVGVPLNLPIVGSVLARALARWEGCGLPAWGDRRNKIGVTDFGVGADPLMLSSRLECRALAARDLSGRWAPRWPVESSAVVRMQSHARQSLMRLRDRQQTAIKKPA
jgi:uncharacterized membrane protein (UPF0127 family)